MIHVGYSDLNYKIIKDERDELAANLKSLEALYVSGIDKKENERLKIENVRLRAERDKAVEDMAFNAGDGGCWKTCATHYCSTCNNGDNFEWRGLEELK